ncbi:MobA/MobL family protein [Burkholderia sp. R-69608]|uniref:MobA/MobL family protein n=1 Tax=Paraburkholderia nemoris TaxID=2793076 RepID=UPI0019126C40|nr:MobA/MobL family protein [Paraburkholderia nemoris]MBK5149700.1 MobA/MobL family protein [Burkholderia sp. R-69608]
MKTGRAGKGAAHALYVQGLGRYGDRDDVVHVEHGNMPSFAHENPLSFWQAADTYERANGRAYREVEFAVPRELETEQERLCFARCFAAEIVGSGHAFTLAIHDKKAADDGRNVHVHLMFSERKNDGIDRAAEQFFRRANPKVPHKGGAAKDRAMNSREFVAQSRALYERLVNEEMMRRGAALISMKRNAVVQPEPKVGPKHPRAERSARRAARVAVVRQLRSARADWRVLEEESEALQREIDEVSAALHKDAGYRPAGRTRCSTYSTRWEWCEIPEPPGWRLDVFAFNSMRHDGVAGRAGLRYWRIFDAERNLVLAEVARDATSIQVRSCSSPKTTAKLVLHHALSQGWSSVWADGPSAMHEALIELCAAETPPMPLYNHRGEALNQAAVDVDVSHWSRAHEEQRHSFSSLGDQLPPIS